MQADQEMRSRAEIKDRLETLEEKQKNASFLTRNQRMLQIQVLRWVLKIE